MDRLPGAFMPAEGAPRQIDKNRLRRLQALRDGPEDLEERR